MRFAYEDGRFEKMAEELKFKDDILKLKVLREINEDVRDPTKIVRAINTSDLVHMLVYHLENKNDEIRRLASQSMKEICSVYRGREQILVNDYIKNLAKLVDDQIPVIRLNIYTSLFNLSEHVDGTDGVLKNNILEILVDKLLEEKEEDILLVILQLMKRLLYGEGAIGRILKTQAITRLLILLEKSNELIREFAALNLASISFPEDGKAAVESLEAVIPLCKLLSDEVPAVREAASLALASLGQLKAAKVTIIDNGYFELIISMLGEKSENILCNIIELIAYVAEEPRGRKFALNHLAKLRELRAREDYEFLHKYIDETIWVIEWKP